MFIGRLIKGKLPRVWSLARLVLPCLVKPKRLKRLLRLVRFVSVSVLITSVLCFRFRVFVFKPLDERVIGHGLITVVGPVLAKFNPPLAWFCFDFLPVVPFFDGRVIGWKLFLFRRRLLWLVPIKLGTSLFLFRIILFFKLILLLLVMTVQPNGLIGD